MNKDKKIHQTPAALKQHAWKTPLSIASLALIAVVSISSVNIDAIAEEPAVDTNRTAPIDYTANTFVKITDALIAGEITPEEAAQKIHTTNRINTYLTKVETDISVAVESGKMTVDEGMEKYDAAVKNINKRMGGEKGNNNDRAQAYLTKVGTEIRAAVSNGEMTPEEGKAKYAAAEERIKQRMGSNKSKTMTKEDYAQGVAKMNRMVKAGEITREQMEARLNRMKKAMGGEKEKSNDRAQAYLTKVGTEIRAAVSNGEMTPEEGKAKYAAAEERIKQRMGSNKSKTMTKEDYAQGVAKMNRMVKAGEITREQMEARLNRMKKAMGGEKEKSNDRAQAYLTKVGTEIKVAVANGELTSEEGKAKYLAAVEGIQKRMARASKGEQSERGAKDRRGNRDRDSKGKRGKDRDRRNK